MKGLLHKVIGRTRLGKSGMVQIRVSSAEGPGFVMYAHALTPLHCNRVPCITTVHSNGRSVLPQTERFCTMSQINARALVG